MKGSKYTDEQRETAVALIASGLSQTQAAKKLDIPKATISYWYNNRMKDDEDIIAARSEARRETIRRCGRIVDRSLSAIGRRVADADQQQKNLREGMKVLAKAAKQGLLGLDEEDIRLFRKVCREYTGVGLRELSGAMKDVAALQTSMEADLAGTTVSGMQVSFEEMELAE